MCAAIGRTVIASCLISGITIGRPVVSHQLGSSGLARPGQRRGSRFCQPRRWTFRRARRDVPSLTSIAPTISILPTPLRPAGTMGESFLVRNGIIVSSSSTDAVQRLTVRIDHGPAQFGAQHRGDSAGTEAELSLHCRAEIPLECVAIRKPPRTMWSVVLCALGGQGSGNRFGGHAAVFRGCEDDVSDRGDPTAMRLGASRFMRGTGTLVMSQCKGRSARAGGRGRGR
jgi:hypothetical protein